MTVRGCHGAGLGLRTPHLRDVIRDQPDVPWFEVHICNYLGGGLSHALFEQIQERYPLSFHGVNLNLAGVEPFDPDYLKRLKQRVDRYNPVMVSEHACFTSHQGHLFHDLLPVPFTEAAVLHLAARIRQVQDLLGRQIMIENLSRYFVYEESELTEGQFMAAVCSEADCGLLLDLNNAYVNQRNLGESVEDLLKELPLDRVGEIHLAGFAEQDGVLIDTHGSAICNEVWDIFEQFVQLRPNIPTLIERDNNLPDFSSLELERSKAQQILDQASQDQRAVL
ncbi:DUF692 domain-containing protein [uncultured Neptuniibacter sp.]|jgi:uncharacterized protein (UPF0276 family)|uniref:MNIO family bufferin maturase n=1 Tax=uncultured Neptuniibacter sp. TaxID=502143 RepID=UPI00262671F9|nr:DUF692 domain-containing protein [uncultured Neptuniibacter sp.]